MSEPPLRALSTPRHACHACGNCCFGHRITLQGPDEIARITAFGAHFGIAEPIDDGALATVDGHCVFLGEDRLCNIHRDFGGEAKPGVCQQYPIRFSRAEDGLRVGVDPGCTSVWRSWRDGPAIALTQTAATHDIRGAVDPSERALLGMAQDPRMTVARLLTIISGGQPTLAPEGEPLPAGLAERLARRLKVMNLKRFTDSEVVGDGLRLPLLGVVRFIEGLDPALPPAWLGRLDAESDALALEVVRRHLYMRLGPADLPPVGQVLMLLSGAVAAGWADPAPPAFGEALSTWARACRYPAFRFAFLPDQATVAWLATGR
jgi:Fe-S-cluster containining protein